MSQQDINTTHTAAPSGRDIRRIAAALGAVVVFQIVMVGSYVAAFHNPQPKDVPVGVVAPTPAIAEQARGAIPNRSGALGLRVVSDEQHARRQIIDGRLYAALLLEPSGDRLLVASASSRSIAETLAKSFSEADAAAGRPLRVEDVAPLPEEDSRGVTPFYLVLAWVVGGYLGATVIGLLRGMGSIGRTAAWQRVGALAIYALVSGFAITLLTAAVFGIVSTHMVAVALLGALVVFAAGVTTAGLQAIFGIAGTAIVLIVFVAFGNPASGGPAARPLLPGLWRRLGGWVVNGAGTDAVRAAIYFPARSLRSPLLILAAWSVAGIAAMVVIGRARTPGTLAELEFEAGLAAI